MIQKINPPEAAIDKVTTPNGCTIEDSMNMEHQGFSLRWLRGVIAKLVIKIAKIVVVQLINYSALI